MGRDYSQSAAKMMFALRDHLDELEDGGNLDPEKFEYSIMAKKVRQEAAKKLRAAGKSNREIAKLTGTSHQTIGRDLNESGPNGPNNGPNGPIKKNPKPKPVSVAEANDFISELLEFTADYSHRITRWNELHPELEEEAKQALMRTIHQCADQVLGLAQAIDGR